jgi:hypothetical protein
MKDKYNKEDLKHYGNILLPLLSENGPESIKNVNHPSFNHS